MHSLDIGLVMVLGGLALYGGLRGFARIVLFFTGIAGGVAAAQYGYPILGGMLGVVVSDVWLCHLLAFAFIFFGVQILMHFVAGGVRRFLRFTSTTWLDRVVGLVLGLAVGLSIVQGVRLLLILLPFSLNWYFSGSHLWPGVLRGIDFLLALRHIVGF